MKYIEMTRMPMTQCFENSPNFNLTEKKVVTISSKWRKISIRINTWLILCVVALFFTASFVSIVHAAEQKVWSAYQTPLLSGSYDHAYNIDLPPGTHGMTPSLSLSYSSYLAKNKAGWVGAGWGIPRSHIQTNTDGSFDLFLNGAKHDLMDLTTVDGRFHTKIETYLKIEKKNRCGKRERRILDGL